MDKIKSYLLMVLMVSGSLFGWTVDDFAYDSDWVYQDLWINGEILHKGCGPDCALRYEALRPLLNQFDRPFSVLEIGSNNGYFCLRIANEYDATCVMMDGTDRLKKICEANSSLKRIIYLQKFVDYRDLQKLAETEHFDVVLCFHVLHHVNWRPFFSALLKLGDYVVIETPPENDGFVNLKPTIPEIARYLLSLPQGIQIGSFVRQSPEIKDHMILFPNVDRPSYQPQTFPLPGISLETFYRFNGVYPNIPRKKVPRKWHLMGQDMILQSL
jgi:SAM-dependent methyltransferase